MPYVDPLTVADPRTGQLAPATWGAIVRDDLEFLIERPMCGVSGSAYRSITTGGSYPLTMSTERFDTDAMHSTSVNNERITIQTSGLYYIYGTIAYQANGTGYRKLQFVYNNSVTDEVQVLRGNTTDETNVSGSVLYPLQAAEYVVLHASHSAGVNLDCIATDFGVNLIRPI